MRDALLPVAAMRGFCFKRRSLTPRSIAVLRFPTGRACPREKLALRSRGARLAAAAAAAARRNYCNEGQLARLRRSNAAQVARRAVWLRAPAFHFDSLAASHPHAAATPAAGHDACAALIRVQRGPPFNACQRSGPSSPKRTAYLNKNMLLVSFKVVIVAIV